MVKKQYTLELGKKYQETIQSSHTIQQSHPDFSRLYSDTKSYDNLRIRQREVGTKRLRPVSFRDYQCPDETPDGIVKELTDIHERTQFYCLCSGGKDSMSIGHWVLDNYPEQFKGFMHIKTNIGIKQTTDWLVEYCEKMGWPLEVVEPNPPDAFDQFVLKFGFPGPGAHSMIMGRLKYSTMRRFAFENSTRKDNHALISGIRAFESNRRAARYKGAIQRDGRLWFAAPFFKKSDEWVYKYLLTHGLKRTPVHDILGMSGECECGSFAGYGERERIKLLDPGLMEHIEYLEDQVQLHGTPMAKKFPKWGNTNHTQEEVDAIMKEIYDEGIIDKIKDLEEVVCGVECGPSTMRGQENI